MPPAARLTAMNDEHKMGTGKVAVAAGKNRIEVPCKPTGS